MFKFVAAVAALGLLAGGGIAGPAGAAEQSVPVKKRVVKKAKPVVVYRYRPGPTRVVYAAPPVYAPVGYYGYAPYYGIPDWRYAYARPLYAYRYGGVWPPRPYAYHYWGAAYEYDQPRYWAPPW